MSFRMAIRGIGLVGAFGCGTQAAINALQSGGAPNNVMRIKTPHGDLDYPAYSADTSSLNTFVSLQKLRRINKYSRMATLGACLARQDAGVAVMCQNENMAVIIASGYGASSTTFAFLDDVILSGDSFASPTLFANSVHSSAASNISILLENNGPCLTITQFEMSTIAALINARVVLENRSVNSVLVGGIDEINPVVLYCYYRFWGQRTTNEILPLDFDCQTAIPGEGAAFVLLTRDEGSPPRYGYIDELLWVDDSKHNNVSFDGLVIPNADGHKACGRRYREALGDKDQTKVKTLSHLYGSMPCGQMFDVALAALASQRGYIPSDYCSFKLDLDGNLGIVRCSNRSK